MSLQPDNPSISSRYQLRSKSLEEDRLIFRALWYCSLIHVVLFLLVLAHMTCSLVRGAYRCRKFRVLILLETLLWGCRSACSWIASWPCWLISKLWRLNKFPCVIHHECEVLIRINWWADIIVVLDKLIKRNLWIRWFVLDYAMMWLECCEELA